MFYKIFFSVQKKTPTLKHLFIDTECIDFSWAFLKDKNFFFPKTYQIPQVLYDCILYPQYVN